MRAIGTEQINSCAEIGVIMNAIAKDTKNNFEDGQGLKLPEGVKLLSPEQEKQAILEFGKSLLSREHAAVLDKIGPLADSISVRAVIDPAERWHTQYGPENLHLEAALLIEKAPLEGEQKADLKMEVRTEAKRPEVVKKVIGMLQCCFTPKSYFQRGVKVQESDNTIARIDYNLSFSSQYAEGNPLEIPLNLDRSLCTADLVIKDPELIPLLNAWQEFDDIHESEYNRPRRTGRADRYPLF